MKSKDTPIVFLPGWGFSADVWRPVATCLSRRYGRISPFFAEPAGVPSGNPMDLLPPKHPSRACLIGWSLGGMLALEVAAQASQRAAAVVAVATNLSFIERSGWPTALPPEVLRDFRDLLERHGPVATRRHFAALATRGTSLQRRSIRVLLDLASTPWTEASSLHWGLDYLAETDLRALTRSVDIPVAWILGSRDPLIPAAAAEAISGLAPRWSLSLLPDQGHVPFLPDPTFLADAIAEFLRVNL